MKLLTKTIEKKLPKLYSTEDVPTQDKVVVAKFFDPTGRGTWYAVEGERQGDDFLCFGFTKSPLGEDCDEWGYFSMNELQAARGHLGLGMERDIHFQPTKFSEIK